MNLKILLSIIFICSVWGCSLLKLGVSIRHDDYAQQMFCASCHTPESHENTEDLAENAELNCEHLSPLTEAHPFLPSAKILLSDFHSTSLCVSALPPSGIYLETLHKPPIAA